MKKHRILAILLAALLAMSSTGCGKGQELQSSVEPQISNENRLDYEKIELPNNLVNPRHVEMVGDDLWFIAQDGSTQYACTIREDAEDFTAIPLLDWSENKFITQAAFSEQFFCYTVTESTSANDGLEVKIFTTLYGVGADGTEKFSLSLDENISLEFRNSTSYVRSIEITNSDTILLNTETTLFQFDLLGNLMNTLDLSDHAYLLAQSCSGDIFLQDVTSSYELHKFDLKSFSIGDTVLDGYDYNTLCKGADPYDFIAISNEGAASLTIGGESSSIDLPENDISAVQEIFVKANGEYIVSHMNLQSTYNELYKVVTNPATSPKILTLAVSNEDSTEQILKLMVSQYNFEHTDYKIEIVERSDDELSMDLISDAAPDMLLFSNIDGWERVTIDSCIKNGMLQNLDPFMEKSEKIQKKDMIEGVCNALESGDSIYTLTYGFRIRTIYVKDTFEAPENWSLSEMLDIAEDLPENVAVTEGTKSEFLLEVMQWCLHTFVDSATATCNFENTTFYKLLELCNERFPDTYTDSSFDYADEFLLNFAFSADSLAMLCDTLEMADSQATFTGIPDANGGQLLLAPRIGITYSCKYPDAAWEFVEGYATMRNTSVYLPIFQSYLDSQQKTLKEIYAPEIVDQAIRLIQGATTVTEEYSPIPNIVVDEAQAYFSGDKSAEDVAKVIQNRVSIYLSEQSS
jgi:hypothetical protein